MAGFFHLVAAQAWKADYIRAYGLLCPDGCEVGSPAWKILHEKECKEYAHLDVYDPE